jgi:Ran GTPase-activating protein 1
MCLQIADLSDIFTGRLISEIPPALTAICDSLVEITSLIELNLSDNAFGGRSVDPIVPFLTHNRSFQHLKLNNNGLGPEGGAVLAGALLESARLSEAEGTKSNLRTVVCGRNRLENGSAPVWADAFAAHGTLVEVRMPQNGIRMEGIIALARGLSECPNLQYLDLQDNTFTEDGSLSGVEAWAEALPSWPELSILNFSDCIISSEGEVPRIISALGDGSNPKLHTLQLQNNNLEGDSFAVLAKAISEHLKDLRLLELQWNETVDDDDESLALLDESMKARGGKVLISDEDEDEDEDKEDDEEDEEDLSVVEDADPGIDALADQLKAVSIEQ